jgi:hypothetical protein
MKKVILAAVSAGLAVMSGAGVVLADEHENEYPPMTALETWTCSLRDGKGMDDLEKANDAWLKWMDDWGQEDYYAAMVTPFFFGKRTFDVGWIGAFRDGKAFGIGNDKWVNDSGDLGAMFDEVITCDSHTGWVSMEIMDAAGAESDDDKQDNKFVLSFSNCSIKEGRTFEEYMAASGEWEAYAKEHGITGRAWIWFPIVGEADNDYDFKVVSAEDDYTAMGENWQKYMDGHWLRSSELFDDLLDCDIARVYTATTLRRWVEKE